LEIAQEYYAPIRERTALLGRAISRESAGQPLSTRAQQRLLDRALAALTGGLGPFQVTIVDRTGAPLASHPDARIPGAAASGPGAEQMAQMITEAATGKEAVTTLSVGEAGDLLRAAFPVMIRAGESAAPSVGAVVIIDAIIPGRIAGKLDGISRAMDDYNQLKAFKTPIKGVYVVFFLGVTLLVIFSATWFGFYIARSITGPIHKLLEGTRAVAAGDLAARVEAESTDELKELVESFNTMTDDLQSSKAALEAVNASLRGSNIELERRRAYTETVLETIGAGVIAIGQTGSITTFNRSAEMILQASAETVRGRHYEEALKAFGLEPLIQDIRQLIVHQGETIERELSVDVNGRAVTLRVSIALLRGPGRDSIGAVLAFDDLSELLQAQKLAAWQEVARRIAHEIKNPLTPILLATERLRKKFLQPADDFPAIFDESTRIVINEVNAMKTMVDEFSNFARMPAPSPHLCDLHALLREVAFLYRSAHRELDVRIESAEGLPPLMLDPAQIKRVFVNLFENAIAAMDGRGRVWVTTVWSPGQPSVKVSVADEGTGIAPEELDKLFLPYFSKRRGGTGLGLAIVHRIITDHNGHITARPNHPRGVMIVIELPVELPVPPSPEPVTT
jgi:two-component system nitrogen regulation sensor histidine kinase NtrY